MVNRLKTLRKQRGLTQQQLSEDLRNHNIQLSRVSISNYERGKLNLKQSKLKQLADYFAVSVSYLKGRSTRKASSLLDRWSLQIKDWHPFLDNNIYVERKAQHLSQNELGKMVDVSGKYISEYELGTRTPTFDIWDDLSKALNSEMTYLQGINGRYYPYDSKLQEQNEDIEKRKLRTNKLHGFCESLNNEELSGKSEQLLAKLDWAYAEKAFSLLYLLIKLYGSSYGEKQLESILLGKGINDIRSLEAIVKSVFTMLMDNDRDNLNKALGVAERYEGDKEGY